MSVRVEDSDGVRSIRIDRPPVNALDLDAINALHDAFAAAQADRASCLVLTGAGSAFSSGVDTRAFGAYDGATRRELALAITRMTAAVLSFKGPLVAAVNGHALGGGFVLMLCADYRICVDSSDIKLGIPEARAGVPYPSGPVEIIREALPAPLLRRLALSSAVLGPAALKDQHVIDECVSAASLGALSVARAKDLAAQPAFAVVKQQVRGPLVARVRDLASRGEDPFLSSFG